MNSILFWILLVPLYSEETKITFQIAKESGFHHSECLTLIKHRYPNEFRVGAGGKNMLWMRGGLFLRFSLTSNFRGLQIEVVYEVKDSHAQILCAQKAIEIAKVCGYIFSKKK